MSTLGFLAILLPCVLGSSVTSYLIGRRDGISNFLNFLDSRKDVNNIIKIRMIDDDIEFI